MTLPYYNDIIISNINSIKARDMKEEITNNKRCAYSEGRGKNSGRIVLHADLNNFFASVECFESGDPEMWEKPVAVCGDSEMRHGIVLAKNEKAKFFGVKTGETILEAKKKCPRLITVKARHELYMRYARAARKIYLRYSDRVEPFGMDEAWIELTGCPGIRTIEDGRKTADEIREKIKNELGITVSVGVSDNKVFAKLGSDYKKPDATTVFSPAEYDSVISKIPVSEVLYVGKNTAARLKSFGITTIGQTAKQNPYLLKSILGKNGINIYHYCRGEDDSQVAVFGSHAEAKSMGNSTTPPKDIENFYEAKLILSSICDTVCSRLRAEKLKCRAIRINFRDTSLHSFERQTVLGFSTSCARDLLNFSCRLLSDSVDLSSTPLRSIGVCAIDLLPAAGTAVQMSLFSENDGRKDVIDSTVDELRRRYGFSKISNALALCDSKKLGYIERGYEVFTSGR